MDNNLLPTRSVSKKPSDNEPKIEEDIKKKQSSKECHEKSIIVLGGRESGKTTMIHRFLEKEDLPKPTIAIDYSYGRRGGKSLVKNIVHVWDIGQLESSLISAAFRGCTLAHPVNFISVILMVDLSRPEILWTTLEESLNSVQSALKNSLDEDTIGRLRDIKLREIGKVATDNRDNEDIVPLRICIIGGKYDLFKDFDSNQREFVGQILRAAAVLLGASLYYHSSKDTQIVRKTKELLSNYGFRGQSMKSSSLDYDKPLCVPVGMDSLSAINLIDRGKKLKLGELKQIYESQKNRLALRDSRKNINQDEPAVDPSDDPNFAEPIIDRLKAQREQEISIMLRSMMEMTNETKIPVPEPY